MHFIENKKNLAYHKVIGSVFTGRFKSMNSVVLGFLLGLLMFFCKHGLIVQRFIKLTSAFKVRILQMKNYSITEKSAIVTVKANINCFVDLYRSR